MCEQCDARFAKNPMGAAKVQIDMPDGQHMEWQVQGGMIFGFVVETDGHAPNRDEGHAPALINVGMIGTVQSAHHLIANLMNTMERDQGVALQESVAQVFMDAMAVRTMSEEGHAMVDVQQFDQLEEDGTRTPQIPKSMMKDLFGFGGGQASDA